MDDENKIEDNHTTTKDISGTIDQNNIVKEVDETQVDSSMWANWTAPKELKGTGFKRHESPKLTSQQSRELNAPVNDFRAQLENAVRGGKSTKPLKVGELGE